MQPNVKKGTFIQINIEEIIIPDSVKRIRKDAFYECPSLHIRTNNLSCLYKDDKKQHSSHRKDMI